MCRFSLTTPQPWKTFRGSPAIAAAMWMWRPAPKRGRTEKAATATSSGFMQRGGRSVGEGDAQPGSAPVFLISFPNVHHAFKCESLMRGPGREIHVMPVPRQVSSSCGLAVEVRADDILHGPDVARELERGGVDYEAVFALGSG
ncbi:MAG TPA: hypothetical protein DDZ84_07285, partial [Firmicutes bacterium]|nr:hypothetical protein [Bacillota bacterium]